MSLAWSATPRKNYDGDLDAKTVNIGDLSRDGMDVRGIDANAFIGREGLAGKLQEDAFKDGSRHRKTGPSLRAG
jgi:hypothetical protein